MINNVIYNFAATSMLTLACVVIEPFILFSFNAG
jgi:hypothetical protein